MISGRSTPSATNATTCAGGRLGSFRFGAISLGEPAIAFKAEGGGRYQLLHRSAALGALADRWIGEFLAKFELVIAMLTLILINRHFYIPPFCTVLHNLHIQYKNYASGLSIRECRCLQNRAGSGWEADCLKSLFEVKSVLDKYK